MIKDIKMKDEENEEEAVINCVRHAPDPNGLLNFDTTSDMLIESTKSNGYTNEFELVIDNSI